MIVTVVVLELSSGSPPGSSEGVSIGVSLVKIATLSYWPGGVSKRTTVEIVISTTAPGSIVPMTARTDWPFTSTVPWVVLTFVISNTLGTESRTTTSGIEEE